MADSGRRIPAAGAKRKTYKNRNNVNNANNMNNMNNSLNVAQRPSGKFMRINNTRKKLSTEPHLVYADIPFYYITQGKFDSLKGKEEGLRAVILDNDETTGYYQGKFKDYVRANKVIKEKSYDEVINDLVELLTNNLLLRPGYDIFFRKLRELKDSNRLDAVIMYTNMEKKDTMKINGVEYNRPQLLAAAFDRIAGPSEIPLFDLLIFRDKIFFGGKARTEKYIAVVDKIFNVEEKPNKYIFLDDKPAAIKNNSRKFVIEVNEYKTKKNSYVGSPFNNSTKGKSIIQILDETFPA